MGVPDPPPDPTLYERNPGIPAAWFILGGVIILIIFEVWALSHGKYTVSQLIQHISKGRAWFKWLIGATMAMLTWHILWGFPKWLTRKKE